MRNILVVLAAIATLALVVDLPEPLTAAVPRWSLLLVLAIGFSGMAYYRWCYDRVLRQRDEMQAQVAGLLPKYTGPDRARAAEPEGHSVRVRPAQGDGQPGFDGAGARHSPPSRTPETQLKPPAPGTPLN